jgi:putative membrane protein
MKNRELKSIAATVIGSLCVAAAAYAASAAPASGPGSAASGTAPAAAPATGTSGAAGAAGTDASGTTSPATATNAQGAAPSGAAATATPDYADDEIISLVLTLDGNEITAGEAAEKKKMGKDAMKFAKMMVKQHREDSTKMAKLAKKINITPANTAKVDELRAKGAADLQAMSGKDSLEFEQAYVNAMVQGHTDALAMFDDHLIKNAKNEKLKKRLEETRKAVANHLEHAKRLQNSARASAK